MINEEIDTEAVKSPYLGKEYSSKEIEKELESNLSSLPQKLSDKELISQTANLLANNKLVAWFQGNSEFGPRALGNRSFLADPRLSLIHI